MVTIALFLGIFLIVMFAFAFKPVTALSNEQLIAKSKQVRDVQHFLSKFPEATVDVDRGIQEVAISYSIRKQFSEPSITYPNGFFREIILVTVYRNSASDPLAELRFYCVGEPNPLATPAFSRKEGDMIGRIDNTGCFGQT